MSTVQRNRNATATTTTADDLSDLDRVIEATLSQADRINRIVDKFEELDLQDEARKALVTAIAITKLRQVMDPLADALFPLMGTKLGFKADRPSSKNPQPYDWHTVRDCMIEALLNGARLTGNEFNIIAGNTYFTKEFFERKIREYPGIANVQFRPGLPEPGQGKVFVSYLITYDLRGDHHEHLFAKRSDLDERIPIKVSSQYDTDDMWIGKATRKAGARVYSMLTGRNLPEGDAGETPVATAKAATASPTADELREQLSAPQPAADDGERCNPDHLDAIEALTADRGIYGARLNQMLRPFGVESVGDLTPAQAEQFIAQLSQMKGDQ